VIRVSVNDGGSDDVFDPLIDQFVNVRTIDDDPAASLDVDDNGAADVFTDGILVARFMVGFTGDALINNAVGPGARRTQSDEISRMLSSASAMLDADGNGRIDLFTDGILIARFMVGFQGQSLIKDAIGSGAARTTAAAVEQHLSAYLPSQSVGAAFAVSPPAPPDSEAAAPSANSGLDGSRTDLFAKDGLDAVDRARLLDQVVVWFAERNLE